MNKQFLRHVALAALLSLPVIGGCKPAEVPPVTPSGTNAAPESPATTNASATLTNDSVAKPVATSMEPVQPEVPFAVDRPIPEHLSVSTSLNEVIKLAQAGVDEEVLLAFVNGATSGFHLGADEIIFLTDIGVPSAVINSMMERDKGLSAAHAALTPAPAATATTAVATAPTYIEPPAEAEVPAEPAAELVTESDFNEALSPYGTWIDIEGYGRCWQPTVVVVNRNWRPYCDGGRWMYTDAGWYWYSDYSWGWAPFHYGRWFSHPRWGWCWNPGYTWGPAWVTWSYTDAYCGWAPLPPAAVYTSAGFSYYGSSVGFSFGFGLGYSCYSYVPWRNFCDYRPWRYCAPPPHCKEIYDRATCYNDYTTDRNRRAVNRGLPPDRVSAYARTEVKRVNLREVSAPRQVTGRREELGRDGSTLEIRRPTASPTRAVASGGSSRTTTSRNNLAVATSNADNFSTSRAGQRERPASTQISERTTDTVGRTTRPLRQSGSGTSENTAQLSRSGAARPLVVVGNGDGRPPTPSTWNPYRDSPQPTRREELAVVSSPDVDGSQSQPDAEPPRQWNQPARPEVSAQPQSQVVRVGRGIQDRPAGSPNYRVYSSPQRPAPSAPSYGPPPTDNNSAPTRPNYSRPSRSDNDDNSASSQPSRQPDYETPRQVERPAQSSAPQRPAQTESQPARVESRPAPASERPAPSRSESNRSESRPAQSDQGRGSRNR